MSERLVAKRMAKGGAVLFALALLEFAIGFPLTPVAGQGGATSDDVLGHSLLICAFVFAYGVPGALLLIAATIYWFIGLLDGFGDINHP